jgi:hypothetical protein
LTTERAIHPVKANFINGNGLASSDDFRQQKRGLIPSATRQNDVNWSIEHQQRVRMARKSITREFILTAILDVVLVVVLLVGTAYVATLCLAPVG